MSLREYGAGGLISRVNVAREPGTAVSVGGASTLISTEIERGAGERVIQNDHATQIVYLRLAATGATLNAGIRLNAAGGTVVLQSYTGPICAIATGAATPVLVTES